MVVLCFRQLGLCSSFHELLDEKTVLPCQSIKFVHQYLDNLMKREIITFSKI
jgi:hypothetical protein